MLSGRGNQSGETRTNGKISRWGNSLLRAYLFEAATVRFTCRSRQLMGFSRLR